MLTLHFTDAIRSDVCSGKAVHGFGFSIRISIRVLGLSYGYVIVWLHTNTHTCAVCHAVHGFGFWVRISIRVLGMSFGYVTISKKIWVQERKKSRIQEIGVVREKSSNIRISKFQRVRFCWYGLNIPFDPILNHELNFSNSLYIPPPKSLSVYR